MASPASDGKYVVHIDSSTWEDHFLCGKKQNEKSLHTKRYLSEPGYDFLGGARKMRWCFICVDCWGRLMKKENSKKKEV